MFACIIMYIRTSALIRDMLWTVSNMMEPDRDETLEVQEAISLKLAAERETEEEEVMLAIAVSTNVENGKFIPLNV